MVSVKIARRHEEEKSAVLWWIAWRRWSEENTVFPLDKALKEIIFGAKQDQEYFWLGHSQTVTQLGSGVRLSGKGGETPSESLIPRLRWPWRDLLERAGNLGSLKYEWESKPDVLTVVKSDHGSPI
jgi:hypothetical protein